MLIGILVMPFLYNIMGPVAFGIIGFYTVIQIFINVLDSGLSPTLCRVIAASSGNTKATTRTLKSFETISLLVFAVIFFSSYLLSDQILKYWFKGNEIVTETIVALLFCIVSSRLVASIYRAALQGKEDFLWLNAGTILFNTIKYPVCTYIMYKEPSLELYFQIHFAATVLELFIFRLRVANRLSLSFWLPGRFYIAELSENKKYILSVAFTALVSAATLHLDKLLFSNILLPEEYGYYTMCITISSAMITLGFPIGAVLIPRLTKLYASNQQEQFLSLYHKSAMFVSAVLLPVGVLVALFSKQVLLLFTSDPVAAEWGETILTLYILGNSVAIVTAFQYYLQVAIGDLKEHVRYNKILLVTYIPLIFFFAYFYDVLYVAILSFAFKLASFLLWQWYVHHKTRVVTHKAWFSRNILPSLLMCCLVSGFTVFFGINKIQLTTLVLLITMASLYAAIVLGALVLAKILNKETLVNVEFR